MSITPGEWTDAATLIASEQGGSGRAVATRQGSQNNEEDENDWGDGVVRSIVIKWTSEHWQGPLHWPLRVRFHPSQQAGAAAGADARGASTMEGTGLLVELHVGYVEKTAALAGMEAQMPEWATLSFEATSYISRWSF